MANQATVEVRKRPSIHRGFGAVYLAILVLSLHWAVVLYVNSTYLERFISSEAIGLLYTIGSALTVLVFLFISRVLRQLGNYKLALGLIALEAIALVGMGISGSLRVVIPLFIVHQAVVPLLLFNLDMFMESLTGNNEESTGSRRGVLLTIMSFAGALAPLMAGVLLGDGAPRFELVYATGAFLLIPFVLIIMYNFKRFQDPPYQEVAVLPAMHTFWVQRDIRFVFLAHFLLQLFFAWSVIYIPLYLASVIGLAWSEIGIVLFIGLMAYVFLEYPIGKIADNHIGEKEMMFVGFIILSASVASLTFITASTILPWAIAMFMTRVGASLVETTTESYFFKHTDGSDANVISFFRITRPLAIMGGALLGSLSLLYLPFGAIFIVLSIVILPGTFLALSIRDTK